MHAKRAARKRRPTNQKQQSAGSSQRAAKQKSIPRVVQLLIGGSVLVGLVWLALQLSLPPVESPDVVLRSAESALAQGEYDDAEQFALWIAPDHPLGPQSRLIAGEAATRAGRLEAAVHHYQTIPRDGSHEAVVAADAMGELFRAIGRLTAAEQQDAYVLKHDPDNVAAHERIWFVLRVTGRKWEAVPHAMFLVRTRHWKLNDLLLLGDPEHHVDQEKYLRGGLTNAPDDVLVKLGLAAHFVADGKAGEAVPLLEEAVAARPSLLAAQALLGGILAEGDEKEFVQWHARLPESADSHPEIWYVRGLWAQRQNQSQAAARCFWETLRLTPEHSRACYQLGQALHRIDAPAAEPVTERARQLVDLAQRLNDIYYSHGQDEQPLRRTVQLLENVGRFWEAWAWAVTASQMHPEATWASKAIERLRPQLTSDLPRTVPAANLALQYDYSDYPFPEQLAADEASGKTAPALQDVEPSLLFEEETSVGIDFIYENGADATTKGARQFEQTGGGVAAFDYDCDGWPDLYFTQGGEWKTGADEPNPSAPYRDHLYRNLEGRSFAEVARHAGLENLDFGQGVSAGDFNNDGFPDLYVANIGRNRLFQNNGDGTFAEVTETSGIVDESWTSSCVIADLNNDGLPDLFDANYLTGPQIYQRICGGRVCSPNLFMGAPDRLLLNQGDGSFASIARATPDVDGKGLGVLAVRLEDDPSLSLFVANDQVANFLLQLAPSGEDHRNASLTDMALPRGLAFSGDGRPLAGMGIAADDVDGDGRIDFLVTNFQDEPNSLYLQTSPGFFVDAARKTGLDAGGYPFVGWGTQFLDANLDGHPDLVVVNGHVDDYRDEGGLYHMPPQFFLNTGDGKFIQLEADEAGDFFDRKNLGRGLARLDWNGDGRMDFVVSNIAAAASLVTNRSENVGHFFNVRLHGTTASRDAIGSVVELVADGRRWSKQLVAGDGYMASNERLLQFGVGNAASVESVRVTWPSGNTVTFAELPTDSMIDIVEGAKRARLRATSQPPTTVDAR